MFELLNGQDGLITGDNPTSGTIDMDLSSRGQIVNHGTIHSSNSRAIDFSDSDGGAVFKLNNTGWITANDASAVRVDVGFNFMYILNSGDVSSSDLPFELISDLSNNSNQTFANRGNISASAGQAISFSFGTSSAAQFSNSGTITAWNQALFTSRDTDVRLHNTGDIITYGTLGTAITFDGGNDRIQNAGTILGHISLDEGDDYYEGNGGTIVGTVFGETGDDSLSGGNNVDVLNGGDDKVCLSGVVATIPLLAAVATTPSLPGTEMMS